MSVKFLLHVREANSYFEEEMASAFGEGKSVDTHFCQWLVSISLHSILASNISTMCAHRTQLTFRAQLQNNSMALLVTE